MSIIIKSNLINGEVFMPFGLLLVAFSIGMFVGYTIMDQYESYTKTIVSE